jgi:zinc transporter, ZIP family
VLTAALYGLIASSGFLAGVLIGLLTSPPRRLVAAVVAFGSGTLVAALTFELMEEALATGRPTFVLAGFFAGTLIYVGISALLDRLAAQSPKREGRDPQDVKPAAQAIPETAEQAAVSGTAVLVGTVLDGLPENAAIGISLYAEGQRLGLVLLAAVFLSNLPSSISSTIGMRQEGRSRAYIITVWGVVTLACTAAAAAGYALLSGLSPDWISAMLALAAGGILAMLADTMMPEAFQNGGPFVAIATAVGFASAVLLAKLIG